MADKATPVTVLLVEDSPTYRELATFLLESLGHVVRTAPNAERALAAAREQPPGIVFMDLHLPGMDGVEAIRHWRADQRTRGVPAVALTAEAWSEEGHREAIAAGFDSFLSKPIEPDTFRVEIARLLGLTRSVQRPEPR